MKKHHGVLALLIFATLPCVAQTPGSTTTFTADLSTRLNGMPFVPQTGPNWSVCVKYKTKSFSWHTGSSVSRTATSDKATERRESAFSILRRSRR